LETKTVVLQSCNPNIVLPCTKIENKSDRTQKIQRITDQKVIQNSGIW